MSKLTRLEVENYKRIVFIDVALGPNVTEISGANCAGKSTTLDSIAHLLLGQTAAPEEPIRKGANKATIKGTFGDLQIERQFTRDKNGEMSRRLRITRGKESYASTESQLRQLIGDHMLDPGDFIALDPAKKFDAMQVFVPGFDFKKTAREQKADYERRTDVNRLAKEAYAAAGMIMVPEDLPEAEVDISAGLKTLTDASERNAQIERMKVMQATRTAEVARKRKEAEEMRQEVERLREQIEELESRAASKDIQAGALETLIAQEDTKIPAPIDLDALRAEVAQGQAINKLIGRKKERDKHLQTFSTYDAESKLITERMREREKQKQKAIAEANLPVPGLTFGDDEVFLNGLPFEQASTAEKMTVGVALACFRNPQLRLIWVRDASLLDDQHYAHLVELSKRFDCQILLETVRSIGEDVILLEEGQVKEAHQPSLIEEPKESEEQ